MITEKDYKVLYYITPEKYRFKLDGDSDPKEMDNFREEKKLGKLLLNCSKTEFLETVIKIFKDKYAGARKIRVHIVDYDWKTKINTSIRKDFKQIIFDFREEVEDISGAPDEFLHNLFIEFDTDVAAINESIGKALEGKAHTKATVDGKTLFTIESSPILKIVSSANTFQMFIDKKSFVDYGEH